MTPKLVFLLPTPHYLDKRSVALDEEASESSDRKSALMPTAIARTHSFAQESHQASQSQYPLLS